MKSAELAAARQRYLDARAAGLCWQDATTAAQLPLKRSAAYALEQRVREHGPSAIPAGRFGHPYKLVGPVRLALETLCRAHPDWSAGRLGQALQDQFALTISSSQINRFRKSIGLSYQRPKKSTSPLAMAG